MNIKFYVGSSSKKTFQIISKYNQEGNFGICLNMYNFNKGLIKKFNYLESQNINLFMDNGSFERFTYFLNWVKNKKSNKKISEEDYFDYDKCDRFFEGITENYKILLNESKNPEKIILTIPEVIGSSELTQKLQKKYINAYKQMEKIYGCKIIISLQFNPNSEAWKEEVQDGANFIKTITSNSWIIGIPFGNDFKTIQKNNNFQVIANTFRTTLKGYKAHLFACGSPTKVEKFVFPNLDFIYSIDASSIMNWSKNSHYFSKALKRVIDIRYLTGKADATQGTINRKRSEFEFDSKIDWQTWILSTKTNPSEAIPYEAKFEINFKNFIESYELIPVINNNFNSYQNTLTTYLEA